MDARKAIFAASGIPVQLQHLVLGCTKLTDPSAKLHLNPADENIQVTCVKSALDAEDVCTWCCDILGVPVESICHCKARYCVTCIRDMTGMNGEPAKCLTCPTCGSRLRIASKSAASTYRKRVDLIAHLDHKYGQVKCPRGCGELYYRRNAQDHMDICSRTRKRCMQCKQFYMGDLDAHRAQCPRRGRHVPFDFADIVALDPDVLIQ
mmetsp:Transcript_15585/g.34712  ORF Transcript_15585/g.34712 Transcript_15585/m.34712 type:complete len:207 (-) Transcript_15585:120-740(-)